MKAMWYIKQCLEGKLITGNTMKKEQNDQVIL